MAAPRPEPSSPHPAMEGLMKRIMEQLEDMRLEAGEEPTCFKEPDRNPDNPKLAWNKRQSLEQESELDALMATPLVLLPPDPDLRLGMATEKMLQAAHGSARTLQFYKNRLEELEQKHKKYKNLVKKATVVNEALKRQQQKSRSKEDKKVLLQRRYSRVLVVFRFLRNELHFILETFKPDEISPEDVKSLEDVLDSLVTRMLQNPSDPYVEIDDTVDEAHLTLLLCCNLIARHPTDFTRMKFVDPRT